MELIIRQCDFFSFALDAVLPFLQHRGETWFEFSLLRVTPNAWECAQWWPNGTAVQRLETDCSKPIAVRKESVSYTIGQYTLSLSHRWKIERFFLNDSSKVIVNWRQCNAMMISIQHFSRG